MLRLSSCMLRRYPRARVCVITAVYPFDATMKNLFVALSVTLFAVLVVYGNSQDDTEEHLTPTSYVSTCELWPQEIEVTEDDCTGLITVFSCIGTCHSYHIPHFSRSRWVTTQELAGWNLHSILAEHASTNIIVLAQFTPMGYHQ